MTNGKKKGHRLGASGRNAIGSVARDNGVSRNPVGRPGLSPIEQRVWEYILGYVSDFKVAPTRREIADHLGYPSEWGPQQAHKMLAKIEEKGYVKLGVGWRAIEIVELKK